VLSGRSVCLSVGGGLTLFVAVDEMEIGCVRTDPDGTLLHWDDLKEERGWKVLLETAPA
jgi:hypothetical protein